MVNNKNVINFETSSIQPMKISKERKDLEKDLIFYLRYIKAISPDSREKFDLIIQEIVEKLKKM